MKIALNHIKIQVEKYENSKNPPRIIPDTPETSREWPVSPKTRFPDFDPGCFFYKKKHPEDESVTTPLKICPGIVKK